MRTRKRLKMFRLNNSSRTQPMPTDIPGLVGWWKQGDWTSASARVSQWNDSSGNARHLLQATGANQPIELPWTGTSYAWFPGAGSGSNWITAPDAAQYNLGQQFDIIFRAQIAWSQNSANQFLIAHSQGAPNAGWAVRLAGAGTPNFAYSPDGTATNSVASSAVSPFSDPTTGWMRIKGDLAAGKINFYTATDQAAVPSSWTQLGSADRAITTGSIYGAATLLSIGTNGTPGGNVLTGSSKWYRVQVWNGFYDAGGTKVFDLDLTAQTEGSLSFSETSSYAATTTIQAQNAKQTQIVGSPQIVGDGAAYFMRASYTQAQPCTRYFLARFPLWTSGRYMTDGAAAANTAAMTATTSTPSRSMNAGSSANETTAAALLATHVVAMVWDGASSKFVVDATTVSGGDPGAATTGGLTILADGAAVPSLFAGGQFKEIIEYDRAHSASEITTILRYLNRIGNLGLAL